MPLTQRILWAFAIVFVDVLLFAIPLTAFVLAYIVVARPAWFKNWLDRIYIF